MFLVFGLLVLSMKWLVEVLIVSIGRFLKKCKIFILSLFVKYVMLIKLCGGVDGDIWVCFFCGKWSGFNLLGDFYGFYKMKFLKEKLVDGFFKESKLL